MKLATNRLLAAGSRQRGPEFTAKSGSVSVPVYGDGPFTIIWRESAGGPRKRAMRSDLSAAKSFAEEIATRIANGQSVRRTFKESDALEYQLCTEIGSEINEPPYLVMTERKAAKAIAPEVSQKEMAQYWRDHHPIGVQQFTVPDLIERLMAEKEKDPDIGNRWRKTVGDQLAKFATAFTGPLTEVRGPQINGWLNSLKVGKYTRRHYRGAVSILVKYARQVGGLPKSWDELANIPAIKAKSVEEVKILTPEQITALLAIATPRTIPFIALTAFAGIRNEEMSGEGQLLDWRDIRFEERVIRVPAAVGKTGRTTGDRITPMSDNLVEWLQPYAKPNGPVCTLSGASAELVRIKKRARIPTGRNETRNSLRKSFISYRLALVKNIGQVAEEAGTSPEKIKSNYRLAVPESEAKRWFDIWPTAAGIVQLNFAGLS